MRDRWKNGSIPLQILKKLGYKIHVFSSADLQYFHMDKILFGSNGQNADEIQEYAQIASMEPCDRDASLLEVFFREIKNKESKEGNAYLFFFDATHSEYSFPKQFPLKFEPIASEIDYLTIHPTAKSLELVKNRYRNAIYYVDQLLGRFFQGLKEENLYENGIIAITGDHGEEFFEEGALFHGSHLNRYQTSVPLFLKFPSKNWVPTITEVSHMDIFPSIIHYLTGISRFENLFDGQSLFLKDRWPYRLAVLQNGPQTPCEFIIAQGEKKIAARFMNPSEIYSLSNLEIINLEIPYETEKSATLKEHIEKHFPGALTPILETR
jgi:membrane-anchored protein YejM (alkaline phosphatase superfamily)